MNVMPSLETVREIAAAGEYKVLPVSCEILSDSYTPIEVLRVLKNVSTHCYLLESVAEKEKWGRYTFLGFDPKLEVTCRDGEVQAGKLRFSTQDPSSVLRQILSEYKSPRFSWLPSFTGGLVGYFAYDYLKYREPTVQTARQDSQNFRDADLMLFDKVIAFDNFRQKMILIVNMPLDDPETGYNRAVLELKRLRELLRTGEKKQEPAGKLLGEMTPLFTQEEYCQMVEKAKGHIREGDVFQIVLANRLQRSLFRKFAQYLPGAAHHEPLPVYVLFFRHRRGGGGGFPGNPGQAGKRRAPHLPTGGHPASRPHSRGGPSLGAGAAGGRKRAGRTQYAGGPGAKRPGKDQPVRHRGGGKLPHHRALFSCHAHRLHRAGAASARAGRPGRRGSGAPRRYPFRRA